VLTLRLPSPVTIGHPSLTFNSSTSSTSSGTLGCVVKDSFCTKFLFCGIVFLSLMSDSLSHFSSVDCGLSPFAMTQSRCSIRLTLRSNIIGDWWFFCRFFFPTMSVLNSLRLVAFPAPFFMDARMGGVVATSACCVKYHVDSQHCVPWSTSVA
jgi:hypothetical protein